MPKRFLDHPKVFGLALAVESGGIDVPPWVRMHVLGDPGLPPSSLHHLPPSQNVDLAALERGKKVEVGPASPCSEYRWGPTLTLPAYHFCIVVYL